MYACINDDMVDGCIAFGLAVWHSGHDQQVTLHQTWLILGLVTAGRYTILICDQPLRSIWSSIHHGMVK